MYRYETHAHVSETSVCAKNTAAELVRFYAELGYRGIFITDHLMNGNIPDTLPWKERVDLFFKGYEAAYAAGQTYGIDVFGAWEYAFGWAHLLTYGLDRAWLYDHPDLCTWSARQYCEAVRADGGFIVHAHPFREWVNTITLYPEWTDGVEVINASRIPESNRRADMYADMYGFPKTAGSDIHSVRQKTLACVCSPIRLTDLHEYLALMKEGKLEISTVENLFLEKETNHEK